MSHPKRADAFRKWSQMMLEQALVPDRLEYKGTSSPRKSNKGGMTSRRMRRGRFLRRKRNRTRKD